MSEVVMSIGMSEGGDESMLEMSEGVMSCWND